ncbi:MAG: cell division protein FtsA [Bacteroidales bacterium]|nr:cell division protein FtsA [Bacteroidales bacterium]MDD4576153.1 cell division protein FtsA [Bacteroidales bacterium]
MENNEIIVGLDIGTTKIAVLVGRKDKNGKLEIIGSGKTESTGVARGQISNIGEAVMSIQTAIREAEIKSGVEIGSVVVGIAGQHIKSIQHRGSILRSDTSDEISRADVQKLIDNMHKLVVKPGEKIINVIPQEYIVDREHITTNPIGMNGVELGANFHIITGNVSAIQNIFKCVERVHCEVEQIMLEPLAAASCVLSDEEKEAGVVLVDIGGGTTDIAIFHDKIVRHTAVIPLGGNIVTEDIKEGCAIIKSQAEALKVRYGSCLSEQNRDDEIVTIPGLKGRTPKEISLRSLASIIQARVEEIIEQVFYEIRNSGLDRKLIAGIVITGGGSQMKHIKELTEFITGMDVRIGLPSEHLSEKVPQELLTPIYSTGIGLVIQGFDEKYSLLNSDSEEENEKTSKTTRRKKEKEKMGNPRPPISGAKIAEIFKNMFSGDEGIK